MPNVNAPFGARPVQHLDGSPWNGKVNMYFVPSTVSSAIFVGDFVKSEGSAGPAGKYINGINVEGMPTVTVAAAGDILLGVVVGFLPDQNELMTLHRKASTERIALVCDAPDVVFEIQENSSGGAIGATAVGGNVNFAYTAGNTVTGRSAVQLASNTVGTSNTLPLRILGLCPRIDNELGNYAKWLVMINRHERKETTGV